jgi:hypothetical protein
MQFEVRPLFAALGSLALTLLPALGVGGAAPVSLSTTSAVPPAQGGRTADPEVRVFLRNSTVRIGEPAQLFIEIDGADRAEVLEAPRAKGLTFEPLSGPSRRESYLILNGRQQRSVRLTFSTAARSTEKGTFEIAPLRLRVDGRDVTAPAEPLILKVVEDLDASSLLVFEREPVPARVYEGEPYDIDLRFGWDATLRAASVELSLPWWHGQDGVLEVNAPTGSTRGQQGVYVNRGRKPHAADYLGQVDRNGQVFEVLRMRRRYIATRAGTLSFGQAVLEFSQLLRQASVFEGPSTREFYATMPAFEVEVRPVPEEGRPFEWTGAVGQITAERSLDRRDVDVGDSVKLQVSWTGTGNLEFFEPPDLARVPGFEGFRVLGVDDQRDPDRRRVVYDIVPLRSGDQTLPAVPLWVFDTKEERYVEVETEPLVVRVRKVDGAEDPFAHLGAAPEETAELDLVDIDPRPRTELDPRGADRRLPYWLLVLVLVAWPFARRALRRGVDPSSASQRRRRAARRALVRALAGEPTPEATAAALHHYLAARTDEHDAAWVGRDPLVWRQALEQRIARDPSRGVGLPSVEACEGLARLLEDLDRARFGDGGAGDIGRARVLAVVDTLRGGAL